MRGLDNASSPNRLSWDTTFPPHHIKKSTSSGKSFPHHIKKSTSSGKSFPHHIKKSTSSGKSRAPLARGCPIILSFFLSFYQLLKININYSIQCTHICFLFCFCV